MSKYDVVVIGGGPGGYVAAIRASQLGLKCALVEKEWLGGVCLNIGCIPSKSLLKNSEVVHTLLHRGREFGFSFDNLSIDYSKAYKRSRQVSGRLTRGVGFLMKKNNISVFMGEGRIIDPNSVRVNLQDGNHEVLTTANIIVATGASPMSIPGIEIDGDKVITYREAIMLEKLPESGIIIGSGAIGVEFATIWNHYGVEVTLIEMLPRIVPLEDEQLSAELEKAFLKRKIKIMTGSKVESLSVHSDGVELLTTSEDDDKKLTAEIALVAIGFQPNSGNLGLEEIGVKLGVKGEIVIDEKMSTDVPGIWAIGDVTAKLMLAHVGSAQGMICAENIAGVDTIVLDYEMMPRATYSSPQIASFGITEQTAIERGIKVDVGEFPFQANGKALGSGDHAGWVKIVSEAKYGEILGAHMIGHEVTELLPELTIAQMMELTPTEIGRNVHAHPTLSEVLMEAAHDVEGHSIHK